MIGSILAMRYFGGKNWHLAIMFGLAYILSATFLLFGIYYISPIADVSSWVVLKMVMIVVVFFALGKFWLRMKTPVLMRVFIVALVIDLVIGLAIWGVLSINEYGLWLWDSFVEYMPHMSIAKNIVG